MNFNETLKDLMIEKSFNTTNLSKIANIEAPTIYAYLNSSNLPSLENAIKLSDVFEVSIDYLLGITTINIIPTKHSTNFYKNYKELLEENNLTNIQIAKDLGIGRNRIYDWKRGALPKINTLIALSEYFKVSIEQLLGRID